MQIRIATRSSPLALAQANDVRNRLIAAHDLDPADVVIVAITTTGDKVRDRPLSDIGGKGLFTKELEDALLSNVADIAVHSIKDIPGVMPDEFELAAILPREDPRDAFISLQHKSFHDLPHGARLGSSSVRRVAQARRIRPDLVPLQFRGNVDTRLRKLDDGVADASFLACAGLNRLGLQSKITHVMPIEIMLPAVAQGAVGLQILRRNSAVRMLAEKISDMQTAIAISCERAFLAALNGTCRTPIAGHAVLAGGTIGFSGETLTLDGQTVFSARRDGSVGDASRLGMDAALEIKSRGGSVIAY
jgi:hydroxymethylbilane synthase